MYRAEVLGSLLRPAYLAEAREKHQAGELPDEEFKKLQDRAVDEAITLQESAGVDVVTDGEMRRFTFFDQFTAALEGVAPEEGEAVPFHSEPGKVDIDFHSPVSVTSRVKRKRSRAQPQDAGCSSYQRVIRSAGSCVNGFRANARPKTTLRFSTRSGYCRRTSRV